MLTPKNIVINQWFVGRVSERALLRQISDLNEASIVVVYGRRRVGKTELLEQSFRTRNILKFEGIEGRPEEAQMINVMEELAEYAKEPLLAKLKPGSWKEVFKILASKVEKGKWTLYFEEVQWLASYGENFISELKYVWDNYFRYNKYLIVVLCGSSPSFFVNKVIRSKALYNRSQYDLLLEELNLIEAKQLFPKRSNGEVMDAFLLVGGFPEYLKRLNKDTSVYLSLCKASFRKNSYFSQEYQRIFTSSMAGASHYQDTIEYLSKVRFASRADILKHLKIKSSGKFTDILKDLQLCGFIEKYSPYNLNDGGRLARYAINDAYLQFYYKFIRPEEKAIATSQYDRDPTKAIKTESYNKYLGFAFERMCRKYHHVIAAILGFSAVRYRAGVFYNRSIEKEVPGYQIDLVFDRDDKVVTVCEIKYLKSAVRASVVKEMEDKLLLFPLKGGRTLHKVLITTIGADESLIHQAYFDDIITLEQIFDERYW